jgi:hypothetical protein
MFVIPPQIIVADTEYHANLDIKRAAHINVPFHHIH